MHMHDKITHMGVINSHLRLGLPCGERGSIVRIDADDIERVQIPELNILKVFKFAAEDEVQQLFRFARFRHFLVSFLNAERGLHLRDFPANVNCQTDVKTLSKVQAAHNLLQRTMRGG
ncbi:conserved hypothetical protein [Agrobacterium tumefaciens str. Kerr 14]|uniref:Uncharacterized protein n=1 Tax=Agrobacterium tumefaciens str. Kerr 14 TaxID=1183424 RepID=A0A1S7PZ09_AGRTU|nr:conserved hypothetical protein [Agrobacterium tumefaciens str. Kerr 14]